MNKEELIIQISSTKIRCVLIDDSTLDPNEIIIITKYPYNLHKKILGGNRKIFISDNTRIRIVKIYSFNSLSITPYTCKIIKSFNSCSENIYCPSITERLAILLVISYIKGNDNWMYYHLTHDVMPKVVSFTESDFYSLFSKPESDSEKIDFQNNYSLKFNVYKRLCNSINRLCAYIIPSKLLGYLYRYHTKHSKNKYIESLITSGSISQNAEVLSYSGASGGVSIKDLDIFLKGNDLFEYGGISNEIFIRRSLKNLNINICNFISVIDYNERESWLKFPFMNYPDLAEYISKNALSSNQLYELGCFLIDVVDDLYEINMNHNDLKPDNILILIDDNQSSVKFKLSDFGCASLNGSFPWKKRTNWGHYFSKRVCGKHRYNDNIIDDAASAYLTYIECGGDATDSCAINLFERIGRQYLYCLRNNWLYISDKK